MWIPFELVHMNFTVPAPPGSGHFLLSSNGLASGNTLQEAISHGLCEVIERDASALFDLSASLINNRRLDLDSINDPYIQKLIQRMNSAGIAVAFWDISSDVGVASFRCHIMERPTGVSAVSMPACGEGCHPLRAVALLRSLTEAAQARLSAIAGVRDDIGPDMYGRSDDPDSLEAWWRVVSMNRGRRQFSSVPDQECESSDQEIAYLLARLRDVELEQVILVNLSPDDTDSIAVVRVIVSGLEPPAQAECIPGRRAECVQ